MRGNLYLIGFMACGKSTIGRKIARALKRPFVDTDLEIKSLDGRSPARIFAAEGEAAFRRLEARVIRRVSRTSGQVIALGGGALTTPGATRLLRRSGIVAYLQVPMDEIWRRGKKQAAHRPLWQGGPQGLARLFRRRRSGYRAAAHLTLRARDSAVAVTARLLRRLPS
jgi:shikimate kinase